MNVETILKLIDAGFSHDEILALAQAHPNAAGVQDPAPAAAMPDRPAEGTMPEADPGPRVEAAAQLEDHPAEAAAAPAADPYAARFEAIEKTLNSMTKSLQAAAIRNTEQPGNIVTLEDAMEHIAEAYI